MPVEEPDGELEEKPPEGFEVDEEKTLGTALGLQQVLVGAGEKPDTGLEQEISEYDENN